MTRLAFMSDLHLDSNHFGDEEINSLLDLLQTKKIDHLHIAGDLSNDFEHISRPFLQKLQAHFPVSYNLGNHDMLGMSEEEIQLHDFQLQTFSKGCLLGLAGWYDYSFAPQIEMTEQVRFKQNFWFDRRLHRDKDDPAITEEILGNLERRLAQTASPAIVALHFVPHQDFIYQHSYFQRFNAFLGSQAFHELFRKYQVQHVVFGHLHHRCKERVIDGVHYHTRPLGYIREWALTERFFDEFPQYKISQPYHLHKRYNAVRNLNEFQLYKKKHLTDELQDALILIEI